MSTRIGRLGETEWIIMKICWKVGKASAKVIHEEVLKGKRVKYQTVKTTLDRLVEKKLLTREKFGPIWLYTPIVSEKEVTSRAIDEFAETVLGNAIAPIFIHLIKKRKYRHEIQELKRLIDSIEEEE